MAVTKLQAVAFKDSLIAEGLAHATIVKTLGLVKSMFELAKSNGMVSANPFADLKLVKPSRVEKPRLSFSQADLDLVFQSPVFTKGQRPLGGAGEAAYWIPLIALMTGRKLDSCAVPTSSKTMTFGTLISTTHRSRVDGSKMTHPAAKYLYISAC